MGAGERVDGVVVSPVGKGGEFVEEVVGVGATDDLIRVFSAAAATGCARMSLGPVGRSVRTV